MCPIDLTGMGRVHSLDQACQLQVFASQSISMGITGQLFVDEFYRAYLTSFMLMILIAQPLKAR